MKNLIKSNIYAFSLIMLLFVIGIIHAAFPDKSFSSTENRLLTKYTPFSVKSFMDSSYMDNLETYLVDQIPYRDNIVSTNTYANKYIFLKYCINDVYFGKDGYLFNKYSASNYNQDLINTNVNALNNFIKTYDCNVYMIPSSYEILNDKLPNNAYNINPNEMLSNIENVEMVENILMEHKNEYIFYKTDHHWTTLGAFYLYEELFPNRTYNTNIVSSNFLGTIHSKINISVNTDIIESPIVSNNLKVTYDMGSNIDTLYFEKYLNEKDQYSYFLDGNHGLVNIVNEDVENGKLLIIKDSFANCFVPFLTNEFHEIDVVDLRYFNLPMSTMISQGNYTNIIVLYNKTNFLEDKNIYKLNK